jgi:hypothetical protein
VTVRQSTPWIGLLALVAMFALPFLPSWLFEGPRTIKHHPRRHVCGDCGARWTEDHDCGVPATPVRQVLGGEVLRGEVLRGELRRRRGTSKELVIRPRRRAKPDD